MVTGYKDNETGVPAAVQIRNLAATKNNQEFYAVPKKHFFPLQPHFTADNHFSGDHVMEYIGLQGFGITLTC
jgi:hypothetical protein